ncbi:uncharacterized protein LOC136760011 [Amia ocellicauda]|uniref:uncharacterized protein LOC136760011 n=1 Tax=Amia ocellicauda TaxID=2972642 RepID=UPI003463DC52
MKYCLIFSLLCTWSVFALPPDNNWPSRNSRLNGTFLYDELWDSNMDIANKTLETDFLKKMVAGTLPTECYMKFTLQDIYYLVGVTKILKHLKKQKEPREDVKDFLIERYNSYNRFAQETLKQYNLKNANDIQPSKATASYLKSYNQIAQNIAKKDHMYFAVALLPCARLWPYLAEHLNISSSSPYYAFKRDNEGGSAEKHYKNLLEKHRHSMKESIVRTIFKQHMTYENKFFVSA